MCEIEGTSDVLMKVHHWPPRRMRQLSLIRHSLVSERNIVSGKPLESFRYVVKRKLLVFVSNGARAVAADRVPDAASCVPRSAKLRLDQAWPVLTAPQRIEGATKVNAAYEGHYDERDARVIERRD
jgi:hypothetical protein